MGTNFTTAVGNPPNIQTDYAAWLDWYYSLLAFRLAECPLERGTTYYFAANGNDSTGDGSIGNPWQTIGKAQDQITAAPSNADLRLRFRRGDTWDVTTGLSLNKANITVDAYGAGAKPFFNRFTVKYAASGWTNASGDRYTRAETSDIAWVRDTADRLGIVYTRVASSGAVESTPLSFYWASNVLHINAGSGVNPNSRTLEAVISNSGNGVGVIGDGCRIEGIRADGWGCHRTNAAPQTQPFTSNTVGTDACVFIDCEGYYSGSHAIAHYSTGGGIMTLVRCKSGYTKFNSAGETIFNYFTANGGHEVIEESCITPYGTLPSSDWVTSNWTRRGQSAFAHTNGGANRVNLIVSRNHLVTNNAYGANAIPYFINGPTANTPAEARVFVVGAVHEGGPSTGTEVWATADCVHYGCRAKYQPRPWSTMALMGGVPRGWVINCLYDVDLIDTSGVWWGCWNGTSANATVQMFATAWIIKTKAGQTFRMDFDSQNNVAVVIKGCVIINAGPASFGIGGNNAAGSMDYNAFYGVVTSGTIGYDQGIGNVTLDTPILANDLRSMDSASPLYQLGDASLGLSHDLYGNRRKSSQPAIGPVDAYAGLIAPEAGDVRLGVVYDGGNRTGTLAVPFAGDVRDGVIYDDDTEGALDLPNPIDVRVGVEYDDGSAIGVCAVPLPADVRSGVDVDAGSGTLVVPSPGDVRAGVIYDHDTEGEALVVQAPLPGGSTGWLIVRGPDGEPQEGIDITIRMACTGGGNTGAYDRSLVKRTSDAMGMVSFDLVRGASYLIRRGEGSFFAFAVPDEDIFELPTFLGHLE